METPKIHKKMSEKECAFPFCSNKFIGSQFQRYCNDPRCVEVRNQIYRKKSKEKTDEHKDNNISIKDESFQTGSILLIRCSAKNSRGRCRNVYRVVYYRGQATYPKFCEEHRNEYKRSLYEKI